MEFRVKKHSREEFLPTYIKWLDNHKFANNCASITPETFLVAYNGELPIYAVPFWNTDSGICIIAFIVSNKSINYKKRIGGLDFLMEKTIEHAKINKYSCIYTSTTTDSIITSLKNNGFVNGDLDSSQFFFNI